MLSYKQMPASRCKTLTSKLYGIPVRELTLGWSSTLMTAVFESPARLRWAVQSGLHVTEGNSSSKAFIAGLCADVSTLSLAAQAGMGLSDTVKGAICEGRIDIVNYLLRERHGNLPAGTPEFAVKCCKIDMLKCLEKHGYKLTVECCSEAASAGQLAALQYILSTLQCTCELSDDASADDSDDKISDGDDNAPYALCDWIQNRSMDRAASSGNVELLQWLQQQYDVELTESAMNSAASAGQTAMCEYLHAQQCPWSELTCQRAIYSRHLDTLRWLHEHGCPWNAHCIRTAAARTGSIAAIQYLQQQGVLSTAAQLTDMLQSAREGHQIDAAKWLRQQGAPWLAVLSDCNCCRCDEGDEFIEWARAEGCTSPIVWSVVSM
jgi:hypothetical protein